jgi:GT2 family glycosyltransferase
VAPGEVIIADQTPFVDRPPSFYDEFIGALELQVLNVKKPSLSVPRNIAARKAKGDILLLLDDDIVIGDTFIQSHLKVMEEEKVDVVNGAVSLDGTLPEEYPWRVNVLDPVRFFLAAPNYKWKGMMLAVTSGNVSIKRDLFLAVGGFDENLPRMVDFELGYRLFRYGAKIYFSYEPYARHLRAEGGSRKHPENYDKFVSALYIHKKHFPGWITSQFVLKNVLGKKLIVEPWFLLKILRANYVVNRLLKSK